jgi:dethiobiotin synthetase
MTNVFVAGTGTGVGKTWVAVRLIDELRARGTTVTVRKPAQSYAPGELGRTDAELLGAASGEPPSIVCPVHRWYEVPMAPPIAADALGRPRFAIAELADEVATPPRPDAVRIVEGAGGPRSPLAHDGDNVDLARALAARLVIVVADAGLGTINAVELCASALAGFETVVLLNRFTAAEDLHRRNLDWLTGAGHRVTTSVGALVDQLGDLVSLPEPGSHD